ncbi:MAG TPA: PaaI family thioesterase, partial [Ktedonobacterales bacterium]|nr:PaaI family thioesterase [Ktedonobacterales bacterium]
NRWPCHRRSWAEGFSFQPSFQEREHTLSESPEKAQDSVAVGVSDEASSASDPGRVRIVRWQDPAIVLNAMRQMTGLDYLRAMQRGEVPIPPIAALMNYRLAEVEEGRAVFTFEPAEYHYNPLGIAHGGVAATLLDTAMACAMQTLSPVGMGYTTLEIKVNYLRPIVMGLGVLSSEGTVINISRRVGVAEGRITDASGKLYAHATTTCLVFDANQAR